MGMRSTWLGAAAAVNGVSVCSTLTWTCSQRKCRLRFRSIAPGQQSGLEQNLKTVADAEHRTAGRGKGLHFLHDGREAGDGAGAQVVAVREPAGQDDDVGALEAGVLVPDQLGVLPQHVLRGVIRIVVAIGSGKDDDREFHAVTSIR